MLETLLNGRYKILWALGSGGFGQTYVAEDIQQSDNSTCVVKQFKPSRHDEHFLKVARRLFNSEAEILRKLGTHDQIPALLDVFEENQEFYLVQEYIAGQTLLDELAAIKRMNEAQAIDLLRDVLNVLDFVHEKQVIHRDIKPGNLIRRQRDGKFVLIDFGAVKEIQTQLSTTEPGQTNLTVGIGTQGYGPSEQLIGKPRYSSDLYALGMTVIHALTGLQPFQLPTHPDTADVVWQDRAIVSPKLAAILTRMTRYHFSQRYQSVWEVLQALEQPPEAFLQPSASGMEPVTLELNDGTLIPTLLAQESQSSPLRKVSDLRNVVEPSRKSRWRTPLLLGGISLAVTTGLLGIRQIGWLQPAELAMFDRMVQVGGEPGPDPRLLVVGITETDIQEQKRFPLSDRTIAQILKVLQALQPRAIGLDLLRDIPQEPGNAELRSALTAPNVVTIMQMGSNETPSVPPPPGIPAKRVGFNDLLLDDDGVVRRNLMFADYGSDTLYSFSLRLALGYLAPQHILLQRSPHQSTPGSQDEVLLGKATFRPIESDAGGYQTIDARGYQILLKYRGRNVARQVSLNDVLSGRVQAEWVRDKVVLIGTTAITGRDLFFTPYSATEHNTPRMAGVLIHANLVSQLLDAALEGRSLFWYWSGWVEALWMAGWAVLGGVLSWYIRQPLVLVLSGVGLMLVLTGVSFGLFLAQGWVPIVAPALAAIATGAIVMAYHAYWGKKTMNPASNKG